MNNIDPPHVEVPPVPPPSDILDAISRERATVSCDEAAAILGVGRTLMRQMIRNNEIRTIRCGTLVRIPVYALRQLLDGETYEPLKRGKASPRTTP